jgi:hypothetical protein
LINQLRVLRKAGAIYTQVLMLTPSPGSKWYEDTYTSGLAFSQVNGQTVEPHIVDGNYVVASKSRRPWLKQLNLLLGYTYFFNPLRMLGSMVWSQSDIPFAGAERRPADEIARYSAWRKLRRRIYLRLRARLIDGAIQLLAMTGLFQTYRRTLRWAWHLFRGGIERFDRSPASEIPMRDPKGGVAAHALPGTRIIAVAAADTSLPVLNQPSRAA